MITKHDLKEFVFEAVRSKGGKARIVDVAKHIWDHHHEELSKSGDLLYTWQYDMRWAAQYLRYEGKFKPVDAVPRGIWVLA